MAKNRQAKNEVQNAVEERTSISDKNIAVLMAPPFNMSEQDARAYIIRHKDKEFTRNGRRRLSPIDLFSALKQ